MNRWIATFLAVVAVLFILAVVGFSCGRWQQADDASLQTWGVLASAESRPELCMDDESRERVRKIMLEALDEALKQKIVDLMDVWLRDSTDQPRRAAKGMDNALRAYFQARNAAMKFQPPECSG